MDGMQSHLGTKGDRTSTRVGIRGAGVRACNWQPTGAGQERGPDRPARWRTQPARRRPLQTGGSRHGGSQRQAANGAWLSAAKGLAHTVARGAGGFATAWLYAAWGPAR